MDGAKYINSGTDDVFLALLHFFVLKQFLVPFFNTLNFEWSTETAYSPRIKVGELSKQQKFCIPLH